MNSYRKVLGMLTTTQREPHMKVGNLYNVQGKIGRLLWIRGDQYFFKFQWADAIILNKELSRFVTEL